MWGKTLVAVLFASLVVLAATQGALAQMEMQTPSVKMPMEHGRGSGGGGPMLMAALLDLKELEGALPGVKFGGDLSVSDNKVFLMSGGGGSGGAGHMLFGGQGWSGDWTVKYDDPKKQLDQATLSIEGGGFLIEHVLAAHERLMLGLGGTIGGGEVKLRLVNKVSEGPWSDVIKNAKSLELKRSYLVLEPYVSLRFKVLNFMGLRLTAGYLFQMSFGDWELPDETKALQGPLKSLGAPVFSVMLLFGR